MIASSKNYERRNVPFSHTYRKQLTEDCWESSAYKVYIHGLIQSALEDCWELEKQLDVNQFL